MMKEVLLDNRNCLHVGEQVTVALAFSAELPGQSNFGSVRREDELMGFPQAVSKGLTYGERSARVARPESSKGVVNLQNFHALRKASGRATQG